mgnify:CR=1 FL=1
MSFMTKPTPPADAALTRESMPPVYDARALTEGGAIALVNLDGQIYTLRITRSAKLILTK